jgi:hypothetical protein
VSGRWTRPEWESRTDAARSKAVLICVQLQEWCQVLLPATGRKLVLLNLTPGVLSDVQSTLEWRSGANMLLWPYTIDNVNQ